MSVRGGARALGGRTLSRARACRPRSLPSGVAPPKAEHPPPSPIKAHAWSLPSVRALAPRAPCTSTGATIDRRSRRRFCPVLFVRPIARSPRRPRACGALPWMLRARSAWLRRSRGRSPDRARWVVPVAERRPALFWPQPLDRGVSRTLAGVLSARETSSAGPLSATAS